MLLYTLFTLRPSIDLQTPCTQPRNSLTFIQTLLLLLLLVVVVVVVVVAVAVAAVAAAAAAAVAVAVVERELYSCVHCI